MKSARAPRSPLAETSARVEFQVQFSGGPKGRRRVQAEADPAMPAEYGDGSASAVPSRPKPVNKISMNRVPKITKLLVLAHHFDKLVREGVMRDYAEIARLTGLSRARVTQITNLRLLAPDIQNTLLGLKVMSWSPATERSLRRVLARPAWVDQKKAVRDAHQ